MVPLFEREVDVPQDDAPARPKRSSSGTPAIIAGVVVAAAFRSMHLPGSALMRIVIIACAAGGAALGAAGVAALIGRRAR